MNTVQQWSSRSHVKVVEQWFSDPHVKAVEQWLCGPHVKAVEQWLCEPLLCILSLVPHVKGWHLNVDIC